MTMFIKNLREVVEERLDDCDFCAMSLSGVVFLSHTQIYRKTKALTGKTPSQFIRDIRLERAKTLLAESDLKIADVAFEVGYSDPSYFTGVFKKSYGDVPVNVRARARRHLN